MGRRPPALAVARLSDPRVAEQWLAFIARFAADHPLMKDWQIARYLHVQEKDVAAAREQCGAHS